MENKKKPKEVVTPVDLVIEVAEEPVIEDVPVVEEIPTEEIPVRVPTTVHTDPGGAGYRR